MAYTGNPSTNTSDALRLRIYDVSTSTSLELLSDKEVTFFLNNAPTGLYAAADAADAVSAKYSAGAYTEKQVGDLKLKSGGGDPGASLRNLSERLRLQAAMKVKPFSGGISISQKDNALSDSDWNRPNVSVGMHDNNTSVSSSTGAY